MSTDSSKTRLILRRDVLVRRARLAVLVLAAALALSACLRFTTSPPGEATKKPATRPPTKKATPVVATHAPVPTIGAEAYPSPEAAQPAVTVEPQLEITPTVTPAAILEASPTAVLAPATPTSAYQQGSIPSYPIQGAPGATPFTPYAYPTLPVSPQQVQPTQAPLPTAAPTQPPQPTAAPPTAPPTPLPTLVPPPTQAAPTAASGEREYVLLEGETPFCIAARFNVDSNELIALNAARGTLSATPGSKIIIPAAGKPFAFNLPFQPHPVDYTVRAGDTIGALACAYGDVTPEAIAQANGLAAPYTLTAGTVLKIP